MALTKVKPTLINILTSVATTSGGLRIEGDILYFNNGVSEQAASGGGFFDDKDIKVSANDTTEDFLLPKLVAGTNITLNEINDGGNETIEIVGSGGGGGGVEFTVVEKIDVAFNTSTTGAQVINHSLGTTPTIIIAFAAANDGTYQVLSTGMSFPTAGFDDISSSIREDLDAISTNDLIIASTQNGPDFIWSATVASANSASFTLTKVTSGGGAPEFATLSTSFLIAA